MKYFLLILNAYLDKANNTLDISPLPRDLGKNNKSKAKNVDLLDNIWWTLRFDQRLQLSLACRILKIIFQNFNFISWWITYRYDKLVVVTGLVQWQRITNYSHSDGIFMSSGSVLVFTDEIIVYQWSSEYWRWKFS